MKTYKYLLATTCLCLGIGSCTNDDFEEKAPINNDEITSVTFGVKDFVLDSDARTRTDFDISAEDGFIFKWAANDTLGIYPEEGDQTYFAIPDEGIGKNFAVFDGGGWLLRNASTYYGYYPFSRRNYQAEEIKTQIPVNYEGQSQMGNNSTDRLGKYDFMATRATSAETGRVDFQFEHLGAFAMIKVTSPVEGTFTKLRITADESRVFGLKSVYDISSATESEIPTLLTSYNGWWDDNTNNFQSYLELDLTDVSATLGQELTFYMMIPPTETIDKLYLTLYTNDSEVYTHDITFGKRFRPGYAYLLDFREALGDDYEQVSPASENTFVDNGYSTVWTIHTTSANYVEKIDAVRQALIDMHNNYDPRMITLIMPEVTTIPQEAFYYLYWDYLNNLYAFEGENVRVVEYNAFARNKSLSRIYLPNVETVSGFAYTGLISVSLPNAITLKDEAFNNCDNLTSVSLPNVVTIEDSGGFSECTSLSSIDIPKLKTIGDGAFSGCTSLTTIDFPEATTAGIGAFFRTGVTDVNLPKVATLGAEAFYDCDNLTSIYLPSLVNYIPVNKNLISCFLYCDNLVSADFPVLELIGNSLFNSCPNLTDVNIPKAKTIEWSAFADCTSLTAVSFPEVTSVWDAAFARTGLTSVNLPKAEEIGTGAFGSIMSLETISLPSAWKIGTYAFGECRYLKSVSLPSLSEASYQIFTGDLELQTLHFGDYSERLQTEGMYGIDTGVFDGAEVSGCTIYIPDEPNLAERLDLSGFAHIYKGGEFIR